MTRVGAVIVGRIGRTSIRNARFECRPRHPRAGAHALQHGELAHRPDRREQNFGCRTAAPRRADGAADFLHAGDLLRRRRVVLTQLGKEARPQLGRVAIEVVPAGAGHERERAVEDQRPRSLRSFCREHDGLRAALAHTEDDGLSEADGVHDGLDLGRSIIQRANFAGPGPTARPRPCRTARRDRTWRAARRRP